MTVIQQAPPATTTPRIALSRVAGIAFVVLYLAGFVLLVSGPSVYEDGSLAEYAAAHADGSRTTPVSLTAFILWPLAGACLIWAVAHISRSLTGGAAGASLPGRVATAGAVAMASGSTIAGAAASAATHVASGTGAGFPADPETGYALSMLGSQVMAVSMWGGSLVLLAVGIGARRSGLVPGWLLWAGIVVAPLLAVAWVFFMLPTLVFLVWVAVVTAIVKTGPNTAAAVEPVAE